MLKCWGPPECHFIPYTSINSSFDMSLHTTFSYSGHEQSLDGTDSLLITFSRFPLGAVCDNLTNNTFFSVAANSPALISHPTLQLQCIILIQMAMLLEHWRFSRYKRQTHSNKCQRTWIQCSGIFWTVDKIPKLIFPGKSLTLRKKISFRYSLQKFKKKKGVFIKQFK